LKKTPGVGRTDFLAKAKTKREGMGDGANDDGGQWLRKGEERREQKEKGVTRFFPLKQQKGKLGKRKG